MDEEINAFLSILMYYNFSRDTFRIFSLLFSLYLSDSRPDLTMDSPIIILPQPSSHDRPHNAKLKSIACIKHARPPSVHRSPLLQQRWL